MRKTPFLTAVLMALLPFHVFGDPHEHHLSFSNKDEIRCGPDFASSRYVCGTRISPCPGATTPTACIDLQHATSAIATPPVFTDYLPWASIERLARSSASATGRFASTSAYSSTRDSTKLSASPTPTPTQSATPISISASAVPVENTQVTPTPTVIIAKGSHSSPNKTPAIVGGVVGGLGALLIAAALAFFLLRRRRQNRSHAALDRNMGAFEKTRTPSSINTQPYSPPAAATAVAASAAPAPAASASPTPYDPPPPHQVYSEDPRTDSSAAIISSSAATGMRDVDDDGVSFRSASTSPGLDGPSERGIPRLPIYPRGGEGDGRSSSRALE